MPTPPTPQRPYDVSHRQNRYVTLPLYECRCHAQHAGIASQARSAASVDRNEPKFSDGVLLENAEWPYRVSKEKSEHFLT